MLLRSEVVVLDHKVNFTISFLKKFYSKLLALDETKSNVKETPLKEKKILLSFSRKVLKL